MSADAPTKLYCLKCRKVQDVKPQTVHKEIMKITSKAGKVHQRSTWVAVCSVCEKSVHRFAKSDKKPEDEAPKAEKAEEAPAKL